MSSEIAFVTARHVVESALAGRYRESFPDYDLIAQERGRDLGDSWAVFLGLVAADGRSERLVGAPVILVEKETRRMLAAQIPPRFDILDAPLVES